MSKIMEILEAQVKETSEWFASKRFKGISRLYTPRQIAEGQGTIRQEYSIAQNAAAEFYDLLRDLYAKGKSITTFGPYTPGQAVMMKRMGIQGIYVGGWATSAKGSVNEDPGADLASYPLSQVPEEAAPIVRALLTADKNQMFAMSRMSASERKKTKIADFRPFIIADADTGHGGDAQVRNVIRRFVEVGVTGYHIEDQSPGAKKCGHQGGKVLVSVDEQIKRLNAARFQLDVMKVPGIIVARTDAEAASLLSNRSDERDQPFVLGVTNPRVPAYKICTLAILKKFYDQGIHGINGHLLYEIAQSKYDGANSWFKETNLSAFIDSKIATLKESGESQEGAVLDEVLDKFIETWEGASGIKTYAEAVADAMERQTSEGTSFPINASDWREFAAKSSYDQAREKALSLGIEVFWDYDRAKTPEGFIQVLGSIDYAIAKSLAVAPFADILWMETKTADLEDAKIFADAIHAVFPDKMLAYNLSPSFNWDTTGMTDEQMRMFPIELGKLGYVFNFITYGGHQIDGLVAEEFATDLTQNGMLALAKLQRKLRLLDSPYKTPQTLVGGKRIDAALTACSGRTATTRAMGKGSTQFQHLVQTEVPLKFLDGWLEHWCAHNKIDGGLQSKLRPHTPASHILELSIWNHKDEKVANLIFTTIVDRVENLILSVRDQNTFFDMYRQKRLMTLMQVFLIHRYNAVAVHIVTPTEDSQLQTAAMARIGIFSDVRTEVGAIIVASVDKVCIEKLVDPNAKNISDLIQKK